MKTVIRTSLAIAFCAIMTVCAAAFEPVVSVKYNGEYPDLRPFRHMQSENEAVWSFSTPDNLLNVLVVQKEYPEFPGFVRVETSVSNASSEKDTGLVEELNVFVKDLPLPDQNAVVTMNALRGSPCAPIDFEPVVSELKPGEHTLFSTPSGRSSNEISPYLEASVDPTNGWLFAIGWTGAWRAEFDNNGGKLGVKIGMLKCSYRLKPLEKLQQPTVLFAERKNLTRREFKTVVHRYMIEHNSPRNPDGSVQSPILALTAGGGNKTPEMMKDVLNWGLRAKIPFDVFWVDAGWYGEPHEDEHFSNCGPNWYRYVGDWRVNTTTHPTGDLLPITDAVHKAGKKFLLWFEPERIHPETPIAQEEPFKNQHGMCWYGDPRSLEHIEKAVFDVIAKHHIDVYRQDFNMDPAGAWAAIDADLGPDRVGIAEAKHVAGLYQFLDDMRAKFSGIMQENCASGGRRIDLEMVKRAHSYCRSDYYIGPKEGDTCFNLGQNMTLNLTPYLPFQGGETNCVKNFDDYGFMSVASSGTVFTPTDLDGGIVRREFTEEENAWFKKMLDWAYALKPFYMGDFYQLTDETYATDDVWCAWSCWRPDENAGFAIAFRRAKAEQSEMTFALPFIDPDAQYEVETFDHAKKTVSGKDLAQWKAELPEPRSFSLIVVRKL